MTPFFLPLVGCWMVTEPIQRHRADDVPAPGTKWSTSVWHQTHVTPRAYCLSLPGLPGGAQCLLRSPLDVTDPTSPILSLTHSTPATLASSSHAWVLSSFRFLFKYYPPSALPLLLIVMFFIDPIVWNCIMSVLSVSPTITKAPRTQCLDCVCPPKQCLTLNKICLRENQAIVLCSSRSIRRLTNHHLICIIASSCRQEEQVNLSWNGRARFLR